MPSVNAIYGTMAIAAAAFVASLSLAEAGGGRPPRVGSYRHPHQPGAFERELQQHGRLEEIEIIVRDQRQHGLAFGRPVNSDPFHVVEHRAVAQLAKTVPTPTRHSRRRGCT